jgi:hypothetical protein
MRGMTDLKDAAAREVARVEGVDERVVFPRYHQPARESVGGGGK